MKTCFPIRNDADYKRALELIDSLWDAEPFSPEHDLLEVMSTLVSLYEREHRQLPPADPVRLLEFKLRELGWSQRELGRRLGWGTGRVSEVLARKRPLTLRMVQELSQALGLPAGLLVHDVREEAKSSIGIESVRISIQAVSSWCSLSESVNCVFAGSGKLSTKPYSSSHSESLPAGMLQGPSLRRAA